MNKTRFICAGLLLIIITGCRAHQPVKWQYNSVLDSRRGGQVHMTSTCDVPQAQFQDLQRDIQRNVTGVLTGDRKSPDAYKIDFVINRYDEGSSPARFFSFGLFGRMYLDGALSVKENNASSNLCYGTLSKWYAAAWISGTSASMEKDMIPKTGKAIGNALKEATGK